MGTMKAVYRKGTNFFFDFHYSKPKCGPNDVIVQVKAAAINPVDYKVRWPLIGPVVGIDVAGYVDEKGSNVSNLNIGDEVYGSSNGSLAEYSHCDANKMAHKPKSASFVEAAAMPIAYMTSFQGLRDYGGLCSGERVLIIGASGGCGISAIQIAKALGAKDIVGVCSGKNAEVVKSLGATEVIDYTKETVKDFCRVGDEQKVPDENKFDVIYDAATNSGAGEDYRESSMELLKPATPFKKHGQYVAINGAISMWLRLFTIGFKANEHLFLAKTNTKDLDHLASLFDDGKLKPVIAEKFSFTEGNVMKGFDLLKSRRVVGKIVFDMGDEE